jgi:hypothetical protein
MGIVYEAVDKTRGVRVALKTLRQVGADGVLRMKHEFRALAHVQHPNLVSLGELFDEGGCWFFTMELVEGCDFLEYVRGPRAPHGLPSALDETVRDAELPGNGGPGYDEHRLRASLSQLCTGLCALHHAGKIHRDIKPPNLRVTLEGRLVLLDFGLVVDTMSHESTDAHIAGTAAYMAPEQAAATRVGPEADWYAVGVVLYEALTGKVPFQGAALEVLMNKQLSQPPPPRTLAKEAPADLDALCARLLSFDPKARPTGGEVLRMLGVKEESRGSASLSTQGFPFVGRTQELSALREAFAQVRRGQMVAVMVEGESGLGKSALVEELAGTLEREEPRTLILRSRCYEREAMPYKALDGAMDALSRHLRKLDQVDAALLVGPDAALIARLFPVFTRVPAVRRAVDIPIQNPQELRNRAFSAVRDMLERLSTKGPLVIAIDDIQWSDTDSMVLLDELMHPPDAPPVLLLATRRSDVGTVTGQTLQGARKIVLSGLSPAESETLARLLANGYAHARPSDPAALAKEAAGHPLFLHELMRHAAETGGKVVTLDDALFARIAKLDAPSRQLLEVVAMAEAPIPLGVAARAAGLGPTKAQACAALLRTAMFLRQSSTRTYEAIEPYHDRVRCAVLSHLDDAARRRIHAALANVLLEMDPGQQSSRLLVLHLEAAGDRDRATACAKEVARQAAAALAFDQAADFYRLALRLGRLCGEDERLALAQLGDALANAGRCPEAAEAFLTAAASAPAAAKLDFRRRASEQLLIGGHVDRGMAEMHAVLAEVGTRLPSTPRAVVSSLLWSRLRLRLRGLSWTPKDASELSPRELQLLEVHKALAHGLGISDHVRGTCYQARCLLLALDAGQPAHLVRALGMEAAYRSSRGRRARLAAETLFVEVRRIAESTQDPYVRAVALVTPSGADYVAGYFRAAIPPLRDAERMFSQELPGTTWELNNTRFFLFHALSRTGRLRELGERLDTSLRDAQRRGDRYVATTMTRAYGIAWLARDDAARVAKGLAETSWSPPQTGFLHFQHWYHLRAHGELALYEGQAERTRGVFAAEIAAMRSSLLMRAQIVRADVDCLLGRLALVEAESGSTSALRGAVACARRLEREHVPYATIWAQLLRAAIAVLEKDRALAIRVLRSTISLADEEDLALHAACARRRLRQLLQGPEDPQGTDLADAWMTREGIQNPTRMTALVAPGFGGK